MTLINNFACNVEYHLLLIVQDGACLVLPIVIFVIKEDQPPAMLYLAVLDTLDTIVLLACLVWLVVHLAMLSIHSLALVA